MKPNLVVFQPSHIEMDPLIEQFCEDFADSHYVYLIRPHSVWRDDSPAGVRFLNHALDCLPRFGRVDTAIAVADHGVANRLREWYPDCRLAVWDPYNADQLTELIAIMKAKVVRGSFGEGWSRDLARAV